MYNCKLRTKLCQNIDFLRFEISIIILQWVSQIWASLTWLRFELCRHELISTTAPAASKIEACFESGQNRLKKKSSRYVNLNPWHTLYDNTYICDSPQGEHEKGFDVSMEVCRDVGPERSERCHNGNDNGKVFPDNKKYPSRYFGQHFFNSALMRVSFQFKCPS